jgi:hypothetical protein
MIARLLRAITAPALDQDEMGMAKLKECPYDSGGYFVIKGTEKVCLIKEQLERQAYSIYGDIVVGYCVFERLMGRGEREGLPDPGAALQPFQSGSARLSTCYNR